MKWGVHRYQNKNGTLTSVGKRRQSLTSWTKEAKKMTGNSLKHPFLNDRADRESKAADSFGNRLRRNTLYQNTKDIQDVNARFEKLLSDKNKNDAAKKADKAARRDNIKLTQKEITDAASRADKFIYNESTRKKAAKYVVDRNMTVTEATKKAKGDAWRNTAALVAVYGGYTLYNLKK